MMIFLDALAYAFLSLAHLWMSLAFVMLLLRRRRFREAPSSPERRIYQGAIAIALLIWTWNGLRPTPMLFEERAGLYWGIKKENMNWNVHTAGHQGQARIAHRGQSSMALHFGKRQGFIIFHHFPNAPPIERYEAVEFHVLHGELKRDPLLLALYSDGKVRNPKGGLPLMDRHRCRDMAPSEGWLCYRVALVEFHHPGGGIVGVGFGKDAGVDEGIFYLDDVHLVPTAARR